MKQLIKQFLEEEDGIGIVEVILILVVLIGLVIIFQDQIEGIVNDIFKSISSNVKGFL